MSTPGHEDGHGTGGVLLSPEESLRRSTPLRSWKASDREQVRVAIAATWSTWREAWGCGAPGGSEVRCRSAEELEAGRRADVEWRPLGAGSSAWWCLAGRRAYRSSRGLEELSRALVGEALAVGPRQADEGEQADGVAAELVRRAWADLEQRLGAFAPSRTRQPLPGRPPQAIFAPWSGALILTLPWWEAELLLLLDGAAVEQRLAPARRAQAPAGGVTPVWRALARRPVGLQVLARPFEVDLGALASLRCGDVLRLPHPLELPLEVVATDAEAGKGASVCRAFLGRVGDRRAVELVRHRASGEAGRAVERRGQRDRQP